MGYKVAILGATGAVGREILKYLEEVNFPVDDLKLLASEKSAGKYMEFKGEKIKVEKVKEDSFKGIDIALFSAGASRSKKWAPIAVKSGAIVIDNSSAFRMEKDVPLVVPEVNEEDLKWHKGIIANPNCSTIQMVVALKPIYDLSPIRKIVVSTYQAVSGAGLNAIKELVDQTEFIIDIYKAYKDKLEDFKYIPYKNLPYVKEILKPGKIPYQIAFNCVPHIDIFMDENYTKEEWKMVKETKKIMHDDNISVCATCVRVPVFIGHSESIYIETQDPLKLEEIYLALEKAPGVKLYKDPRTYPTPVDVEGENKVLVGRVRKDLDNDRAYTLWVVGDNLRKGAAQNAVQIAESLIKLNLI